MGSVVPVDEEYRFGDDDILISQTDREGKIVYANKHFRNVSGYDYDELIGRPHSIVRHPDMPHATFAKMWDTIKSGQVFNGVIKNMRKDGKYYWVDLEILPVKNDKGEVTGYIAAARAPSRKDIEENAELYARMLKTEKNQGEDVHDTI